MGPPFFAPKPPRIVFFGFFELQVGGGRFPYDTALLPSSFQFPLLPSDDPDSLPPTQVPLVPDRTTCRVNLVDFVFLPWGTLGAVFFPWSPLSFHITKIVFLGSLNGVGFFVCRCHGTPGFVSPPYYPWPPFLLIIRQSPPSCIELASDLSRREDVE